MGGSRPPPQFVGGAANTVLPFKHSFYFPARERQRSDNKRTTLRKMQMASVQG